MTRWLVTGAGGMLGTDIVAVLTSRGEPVTGMNRAGLDVTDAAAVCDAIARCRPDVVVNCAAWTAVDDAEASEEKALAVNAGGAANLAAGCAASGARLVQVSTDYVFAGDAGRPYAEDDVPAPRTAYADGAGCLPVLRGPVSDDVLGHLRRGGHVKCCSCRPLPQSRLTTTDSMSIKTLEGPLVVVNSPSPRETTRRRVGKTKPSKVL